MRMCVDMMNVSGYVCMCMIIRTLVLIIIHTFVCGIGVRMRKSEAINLGQKGLKSIKGN